VEALRRVPVEFLPFEAAREPRAAGRASAGVVLPDGELGIGALLRFKSLMAAEGLPVHLARMCYDRLYAYERIAAAHAGSREDLRRLALELFQIYHRRSAGLPAQ